MDTPQTHHLKKELYELIKTESYVFDFLQSGSLDGLWYCDVEDGNQEWMNAEFWTLLGYDPKEKKHLASEWQDLIFPEDLELALENFQRHCEDPNHPYDQVVRYKHKDGSTVWVRCRGMGIRNESGKVIRMLGVHNDLTPLKKVEQALMEKNQELEHLARHDYQTSLYNRLAFSEIFEREISLALREQVTLSLAMIDIDHFKKINDNLGHLQGDKVLVKVAQVLKQTARECDILARFGGEEFVVLMYNTTHDEAKNAAERFRETVEKKISAGGKKVTISVGVTTYKQHMDNSDSNIADVYEAMLSLSDKALYQAKRNGRNRVCC